MYKLHPDFKEPPKGAKIWRYLDFAELVSLFNLKCLYFVRSDQFHDPFEGSWPKTDVAAIREVLELANDPEVTRLSLGELAKRIKYNAFISSWHVNEGESEAMWMLYSEMKKGVAIQSTFERLSTCFIATERPDIHIGLIEYINYETDTLKGAPIFAPFLRKRKSFEHEKELRAIIINLLDFAKNIQPSGIGMCVPCDLEILIEKIVISPMAEKWFGEIVRSVASQYGMNFKIESSALNATPNFLDF